MTDITPKTPKKLYDNEYFRNYRKIRKYKGSRLQANRDIADVKLYSELDTLSNKSMSVDGDRVLSPKLDKQSFMNKVQKLRMKALNRITEKKLEKCSGERLAKIAHTLNDIYQKDQEGGQSSEYVRRITIGGGVKKRGAVDIINEKAV